VLAGSGEPAYEAWLRQQVQLLDITQDVFFTGFLAGEQKRAALADCDIFVLPSYSENFGVVVVEAMASGLPVVVSDQVGIAQEVAQAPAGLVVPCNPRRLADALRLLIDNHDLRQKLGTRGRMLVQQRFSLDTMTTSLLKLYTNLVEAMPERQEARQ
jgi:glycosyltransferase involved in cell wall biosynthesis